MCISETPPNQPDYPWFFKCSLNLGQEKPMLIKTADMSHLPLSATGLVQFLFYVWKHNVMLNQNSFAQQSNKSNIFFEFIFVYFNGSTFCVLNAKFRVVKTHISVSSCKLTWEIESSFHTWKKLTFVEWNSSNCPNLDTSFLHFLYIIFS